MFNDRYGLTKAVLDGRKTMTRRLASKFIPDTMQIGFERLEIFCGRELRIYNGGKDFIKYNLPYKVGEIVAIAQSYKDAGFNPEVPLMEANGVGGYVRTELAPGWTNKMFVRADLMPHQIRITGVKVERLQDISDEDCIKEGIYMDEDPMNPQAFIYTYPNAPQWFFTPREAYAALIDRISGKGTWKSNPYVFAYDFELVK